MEKICIYPEQGAEITAYERALNCLIFMLVYLLAGSPMHVSSSHIWNTFLLYRLVCGSRQFLLDRDLIMEETEHI